MKHRPKGTDAIYETGDKRKEFRYRGELIIGKKDFEGCMHLKSF